MICGVAAAFFGASLVSAAEVSTSNSGSGRSITQGDLGRAVISEVTRTSSTSADGRTVTRTTRFTVTADDADVYIPTTTTGRGGAIEWQNGVMREVSATLASDATVTGGRYVVSEGESESFTITYVTNSRVWYRSEPVIKAIRFSTTATSRLMTVQFPKVERVKLPEQPRPGVSPVASTSPVKVYCVSGSQNFAVGTERTSITNPDGTTSVIADARFVCRIKDGRGVWEREGSMPGKPTNPVCIKGSLPATGGQSSSSNPSMGYRPSTQECLGGTGSSTPGNTGSSTGMTGGIGTPKPGVLPVLCRWLDKNYKEGAQRPHAAGLSTSFTSRMTPYSCQNGQWKPVSQPAKGMGSSSIGSTTTTTRSGMVRGASTDIYEQLATVLVAAQEFLYTIEAQQ